MPLWDLWTWLRSRHVYALTRQMTWAFVLVGIYYVFAFFLLSTFDFSCAVDHRVQLSGRIFQLSYLSLISDKLRRRLLPKYISTQRLGLCMHGAHT
jgi:hypothetical protein